jgi:hypothetical protein
MWLTFEGCYFINTGEKNINFMFHASHVCIIVADMQSSQGIWLLQFFSFRFNGSLYGNVIHNYFFPI